MLWVLRTATEEDREFAYGLHKAALGPYIAQTWGWDEQWQRAHFAQLFEPSRWQIIVVAGQPVGILRVRETDDEIEIEDIEIEPAHQRHRIGTSILSTLLATPRRARLQVLKVNPSRRLYERLGFRVADESDTHFRMVR